MRLAFPYALCHCFSMLLGRHSSRHLGVLTRYLGVLARYLGVLTRSPLTTISSWVDKGMVAFLGGASAMSFKNFTLDRALSLASGCLLKNLFTQIMVLPPACNACDCASAFLTLSWLQLRSWVHMGRIFCLSEVGRKLLPT